MPTESEQKARVTAMRGALKILSDGKPHRRLDLFIGHWHTAIESNWQYLVLGEMARRGVIVREPGVGTGRLYRATTFPLDSRTEAAINWLWPKNSPEEIAGPKVAKPDGIIDLLRLLLERPTTYANVEAAAVAHGFTATDFAHAANILGVKSERDASGAVWWRLPVAKPDPQAEPPVADAPDELASLTDRQVAEITLKNLAYIREQLAEVLPMVARLHRELTGEGPTP